MDGADPPACPIDAWTASPRDYLPACVPDGSHDIRSPASRGSRSSSCEISSESIGSHLHADLGAAIELVKAAVARAEQTLLSREEALARREAMLHLDRENFEREKRAMAAGSGPRDLISLSLGGEKVVTTKREVLCAVRDSLLATMFSGRWDISLDRDTEGHVFLDHEFALFMPLLRWLRAKHDSVFSPDEVIEAPDVPAELQNDFRRMLRKYGLESEVLLEEDSPAHNRLLAWDPKDHGSGCGQLYSVSAEGRTTWKALQENTVSLVRLSQALQAPTEVRLRVEATANYDQHNTVGFCDLNFDFRLCSLDSQDSCFVHLDTGDVYLGGVSCCASLGSIGRITEGSKLIFTLDHRTVTFRHGGRSHTVNWQPPSREVWFALSVRSTGWRFTLI